MHIAPCTLHHWACRPLVDWLVGATVIGAVLHAAQVSRCGRNIVLCSFVPLSLVSSLLGSTHPSLADPRFRRASERHARTIVRCLQIESTPPLNCRITAASWAHGCPVRPHQGCHQGYPLTDRERVTGVNDVVGPPRRSMRLLFKIRVGRWLAPPLQRSTCSHLAPWNRSCLFLLQPLSISGRLASSHRRHQGRHTHPFCRDRR